MNQSESFKLSWELVMKFLIYGETILMVHTLTVGFQGRDHLGGKARKLAIWEDMEIHTPQRGLKP